MNVVFAGTPDFSVEALRRLAESSHDVVGVLTNPDRPRGRGRDPLPPPVKETALAYDIDVFQPDDVDDPEVVEQLESWNPDVMVVAAYGQILPEEILELPTYGCLNIHASLLPKYRGAAPINWAIVRGETETGVTIMQMDAGLDTGPMLLKKRVDIDPLETGQELHDELAELGAEAIIEALEALEAGGLEATPQDDDEATYAPMLSKSDGAIDWSVSAEDVANHIRGFNPWPGAYSELRLDGDTKRIKFHLARPVDGEGEPGEVIEADRKAGRLVIACGEGAIESLELQAPGRKRMDAGDFLNGNDLSVGDQFIQPE